MAAPTVTTVAPTSITADGAASGGEVTAAGLTPRVNACTNPKPIHTANALPAGWNTQSGTNCTYTYSNGGVYDGITSKHVRIVGGASANAYAGILVKARVAAECSPGDVIQVAAVLGEASFTGCQIRFNVMWYNAADAYLSANVIEMTQPSAAFVLRSGSVTAPANATRYSVNIVARADFHQNDVQDYSIAEVLIENAGALSTWFSGDTSGAYWTSTADASISILDGITARGVCWNAAGTPTIADSKTDNHTHANPGNVSAFTSAVTGLIANRTHYVRAYATNSAGTSYGAEHAMWFSRPPAIVITAPATEYEFYDVGDSIAATWTYTYDLSSIGEWGIWLRSGRNEWSTGVVQAAGAGTSASYSFLCDKGYGKDSHIILAWRLAEGYEWTSWATSPVVFTVGLDPLPMPSFRPELLSVGVGPLVGATPAEANPTLDISDLCEGLAWDKTSRGGLGGLSFYMRQPELSRPQPRTLTNLCPDPLGRDIIAFWPVE